MEWFEKEESGLQDQAAFELVPRARFALTNVSSEPFLLIHRKRKEPVQKKKGGGSIEVGLV